MQEVVDHHRLEDIQFKVALRAGKSDRGSRSEEHTSELQSHHDLVCRLLLKKKKPKTKPKREGRHKHMRGKATTSVQKKPATHRVGSILSLAWIPKQD